MNKLDFTLQGGDPMTLDNLEYSQDSVKNGIGGLATAFQIVPGMPVILSGISLISYGGGSFSYTEGYVLMNGEVFYCPASIVFTIGQLPFFDVNQTFDVLGDETFENLTPQSTYLKREATLILSTGSPTEIAFSTFVTVKNVFAAMGFQLDQSTAWTGVTFSSSWVNASGGAYGGNAVRFRKNKVGSIELDGTAYGLVGAVSNLILILPVGYRPATIKTYPVYMGDTGSGAEIGWVLIETSGAVKMYNLASHITDFFVSLDGITFPL